MNRTKGISVFVWTSVACAALGLAAGQIASCAGSTFVVQQYAGPPRPKESIAILRLDGADSEIAWPAIATPMPAAATAAPVFDPRDTQVPAPHVNGPDPAATMAAAAPPITMAWPVSRRFAQATAIGAQSNKAIRSGRIEAIVAPAQ